MHWSTRSSSSHLCLTSSLFSSPSSISPSCLSSVVLIMGNQYHIPDSIKQQIFAQSGFDWQMVVAERFRVSTQTVRCITEDFHIYGVVSPNLLAVGWLRELCWDCWTGGQLLVVRKLDLSHLCFSLNFYFLMFLRNFLLCFPLLTYSKIILFLICWSPKTLKTKEKQDSIPLIQGTV